jgi:acetolactate synthase-1/2/3 large subunit
MAQTTSGNQLTGAEAMVRMLEAHGVRHIFGLCGDTTLPFYDALYRLDHDITHILTRDERSAAYMADGYARVTNRVGVCEGPSGGGATYIVPGLVEANESSSCVLAITSDVAVTSAGHYPLTELDQTTLFKPLTKWNAVIPRSDMVPDMVRQAFRTMTTGRPGAAHLGFPIDVQRGPADADGIWADERHAGFPSRRAGPDPNAVEAALDAILSAKQPVVICGGGVVIAGGEAELDRLARRLDITVATTVSGQGSLADSHPNCLGVIGSNGGVLATREAVEAADLAIFVGCRAGSVTTERWRFPKPGTRIVHIDVDPEVIAASYPTEVGITGDARLTLAAINAALDAREAGGGKLEGFGGAETVAALKAKKFAIFEPLAASDQRPITPERLIRELQGALPDGGIVIADPGTPCPYVSAYLEQDTPGRRIISNRAHGALGYSLSAAIGAWYGRPEQKIVSMMGDGSFGFTCGEFETVTRYNMPITFIVVSNAVYGWIKAGQKSGFEERYFSVDFNRTDHAAVASAFGVKSWRVEDPAELGKTLKEAMNHDGPTLVDVICQPLHEANAPVSEWIA